MMMSTSQPFSGLTIGSDASPINLATVGIWVQFSNNKEKRGINVLCFYWYWTPVMNAPMVFGAPFVHAP